ncbi:type II toxin-antitoxin system PemK/MazF family toxin [Paenibacillus sp. EPM92]|uniref:type II toxin-antitoxin system PemK/MazF family toxin n=1 Tax=Paenibacillus sp. EPM92 TaxID=1561195 RepID=UPI001916740A|nr:type II toxin-antitoxin system PemK/MazF family toxin [Paenibacillus sp. EPM92]
MLIDQGNILLIDLTKQISRPFIIVSNNVYNRQYDEVIVAKIIAKIDSNANRGIRISGDDLVEGEIREDWLILPDKLITFPQQSASKKLGKVKPRILSEVIEQIRSGF